MTLQFFKRYTSLGTLGVAAALTACGGNDSSSSRDPRIDDVELVIAPMEATVQVGDSTTYAIQQVTVTIDDGEPQTFDAEDLEALPDNEDLTPEERDAIIAALSTLEWSSQDEDVGTISKDPAGDSPVSISATATGLEPGETTITAELFDEEDEAVASDTATLIVVLRDEGEEEGGTGEPEGGTEPEPEPEAGTEPEPEPEAGTGPEPEAGTEPESEAGTEPEPEPEAGTGPVVDAGPPDEPEPEAGPEGGAVVSDPCLSNPCLNGGTCDSSNPTVAYSCTCAAGFEGSNCETPNPCDPSPCQNDGECVAENAGYSCECAPGYEGPECEDEIDECDPNPCQNGGECVDAVADYSCECAPGYEGDDCEEDIDECDPNPCVAGECVDGVAEFDCDCPPNRIGDLCETEVDDCQPDPCNGQTCEEVDDAYQCTCEFPFKGRNCDECEVGYGGPDCVPVCNENACVYGTCVVNNNTYACNCLPGFTGFFCDSCAPGWEIDDEPQAPPVLVGPAGLSEQIPTCEPRFTDVASGLAHYCAIQQVTGALWCDGNDEYEQVSGAPEGSFSDVSAGESHSCAIRSSNGSIVCWGASQLLRSKVAPEGYSIHPVLQPPTNGPYVQINSGSHHACAIRSTGIVDCWGVDYEDGRTQVPNYCPNLLPTGNVQPAQPIPYYGDPVELHFTDVAAGERHTCGTVADTDGSIWAGQVICWGDGAHYDFPRLNRTESCGLMEVLAEPQGQNPEYGDLGAGSHHSCVAVQYWEPEVQASGGVSGPYAVECDYCGDDPRGQPGEAIYSWSPVDAVSGGYLTTCALQDGYPTCWGFYTEVNDQPTDAPSIPMSHISVGGCFVTGLGPDGELVGWGFGWDDEYDGDEDEDWAEMWCVGEYFSEWYDYGNYCGND